MIDVGFRADLHCHSTCSDGTFTPIELVRLAKQLGLSALSITDHDSVDAYATAIPEAERLNIKILTGVEFSTDFNNTSIHLLAYGFDINDPNIVALCARHATRRAERNAEILKLLAKHGMPLTLDELTPTESELPRTLGRPHIADAMVKKGYVGSIAEAFKKYIGEGCLCYAPGIKISVEETLDIIHKAKAAAVIAHPHLVNDQKALNALLKMPFDGIECYYARFPAPYHERWLKIAKKNQLLITGGSDFHGTIKPNLALGSSWIDETLYNQLLDRITQHKLER